VVCPADQLAATWPQLPELEIILSQLAQRTKVPQEPILITEK